MNSTGENSGLEKISLAEALQWDFFSRISDRQELKNLANHNPGLTIYKAVLHYQREHFMFMYNRPHRRGEIVFMLENTHNDVLLHTKPFFPNGVYRLLSGGINMGEAVAETLHREVYEETGFHVDNGQCIALIFFIIKHESLSMPFLTFLYRCNGITGEPVVHDHSENISGFRWVAYNELNHVYRQLLELPEDWKDWGVFRALPHKIFYDILCNC
ncbi:MAG TPA: NUDIX hydrolase [bacterium]|nr:NUDIX hydrolase [bacterium]HPN43240.1 NUDIX hydrolase [bacterium]